VSVSGAQDLDERERAVIAFSDGEFAELAAKPVIAGSGTNFQRHCAWAVFLGIGFKFNDFIQAIHRIQRFGQTRPVRIDLIYSEDEREVRRTLERRWAQHEELAAAMSEIIREHGLGGAQLARDLVRAIGVERVEVVDPAGGPEAGGQYRLVNADCVEETRRMTADSVDLVVTSIPFSTQYEYTPSYNDFGHTDDDAHFWAQMDFLIPELLRVTRPGRVAAIHVKDRITPGGLTGLGFQTVSPFSDDCVAAFRRHGWAFLARKTIVTDVVRENNQTCRLGWSEQCKDGSRMGCGLPEYLLLFRKPPTDRSNGYADVPVVKAMPDAVNVATGERKPWGEHPRNAKINPVPGTGYSRARWQLDAHGFSRSTGDRPLAPDELTGLPAEAVYKVFRAFSAANVLDHEHHVRIGEHLDQVGKLPPTFMLIPPTSWHDDVWSDVTRMRTLNGAQSQRNREMHLCPLQFDVVDRAVRQFTMPGEIVFDPFGGLMTVPYRAILMGRRGIGIELNPRYFLDGIGYVETAAKGSAAPSLFDFLDAEASAASADGMPALEAAG
jgi:SAM-dependent methyltransferase